jgi:cyclophilin family peptidyl-prolyl cis-trans isomerase
MSISRIILLALAVTTGAFAQTTVPTVSRIIPTAALAPNGATAAINLADYFGIPGVSGQIVQFDTVLGKFDVELRADAAPREVANFLGYVERGDYSNSFFHRSSSLDGGAISIVQGGGFYVTSGSIATVPAQAPVPLEYNLANERGTLAAARADDPNSATSQWYFNVRDNSAILGPSNGGGYTVFGRVLGSGMSVVDAIAALPRVNAGSPFDELPVRDYSSGNVQTSNLIIVNSITEVTATPSGSGSSFMTFAAQSSDSSVVSASISGSVLTLMPGNAGTATVTVTATDINGNSVTNAFSVVVTTSVPTITVQPNSYTVATGSTVVLTAGASTAASYQWQHNGADVFGATDPRLVITNAGSADAGTYTLVARNANGSVTSNAATVTVNGVAPASVGHLINLSIRSNAGTGAQTLIVGFTVGGSGASGSQPLLLRAAGPSLAQFGLSSYLSDPVETLYSGSNVVASNDNWNGDALVSSRGSQVNAFPFTSANSLDAALAISQSVGTYTMQVNGNNGGTGAALVEIYDATPSGSLTASSPRLINVSARTQAGVGDNTLFAGFVVGGDTAKTVLIRATGPALTQFGVSGVLADPKLQLRTGGSNPVLIAENDNWGGDPQISAAGNAVSAFPLTNGASTDSALLVTLPPGSYTAQVSGADGGTGVALVEVYDVP